MGQLEEQIKVVVWARLKVAELKGRRDVLLEDWNKTHQVLFDTLTQAGAEVAVVEGKLRELTLQAYAETGNKAPAVGVGIRETTKLVYDEKVALNYAKEHLLFLQLNKTAFEKFAKDEEPDFVTITKEPQATIATDLEKVLTEVK